jgi:hypothetical protein
VIIATAQFRGETVIDRVPYYRDIRTRDVADDGGITNGGAAVGIPGADL